MAPFPKVVVLGRGRLGGALTRALRRAGPVRSFDRPGSERLEARRRRALADAEVVLLCVPDGLVAEVAAAHAGHFCTGQVVAHCAGALDLGPLAPAAARGAHLGSLHPLCAVPSPRTSLAGAAAAVSGDPLASRLLSRLAREAGMRPFALPAGDRALYHAAAVLAANGLVALAAESADLLRRSGLDEQATLAALSSLMGSALRGVEAEGLPGALSGPVARGDAEVVAAHLRALGERGGPRALPLYRALSGTLLELSGRLGRARPGGLGEIAAALSAPAPRAGRGRAR